MSMLQASQWFEAGAGAAAGVDLVVFPYAGGSPAAFRSWWLDSAVAGCRVRVLSLPGRGARFGEAPIDDFESLVDIVVGELDGGLGRPCMFFGHSLGAYVAFEVARRLRRGPDLLVVGGAVAPTRRVPAPVARSSMTSAELVAELRRLDGTPAVILENAELLELLMPAIRADFRLVDSYRPDPTAQVDCPIRVLTGAEDPQIDAHGLAAWARHTTHDVQLFGYPGGHFFVHTAEADVIDDVVAFAAAL